MKNGRSAAHRSRAVTSTKLVEPFGDFTLEVERDGVWYVGQLREVPEVISQGRTRAELRRNIDDAYRLLFGRARVQRALPRRAAKK